MIQIDMQAGKNGQTLHVGGIKEVGIVVSAKDNPQHCGFCSLRAGKKIVSEIRADSISFSLKSIVRLFEA